MLAFVFTKQSSFHTTLCMRVFQKVAKSTLLESVVKCTLHKPCFDLLYYLIYIM